VLNMQNLLGNFGAAGGANFNFTVVQQISWMLLYTSCYFHDGDELAFYCATLEYRPAIQMGS
jgi:hypothetical protein